MLEKLFNVKLVHHNIRTGLRGIEEGRYNHLHFGYWLNSSDSVTQAQENLCHLIKSYIPKEVKDILDVGGGIGSFAARLGQDRFNVACLVPDFMLIKKGRALFSHVTFLKGTAEFFWSWKKYDAGLLVESYSYFSYPRRALSNIDRHLKGNGYLILADGFWSMGQRKATADTLFAFLAEKSYRIVQRMDLTEAVLPTCDFLIDYFNGRDEIYFQRWQKQKQAYQAGDKRYLLLVCQKEGKNNLVKVDSGEQTDYAGCGHRSRND